MSAKNIGELIRQLRSTQEKKASRALAELRTLGYLSDGSLENAYLRRVDFAEKDLSRANLSSADLRGAMLQCVELGESNLAGANLQGADLRGARLHGADLRNARLNKANLQAVWDVTPDQLASTSRMRAARMPDGRIYDGRFCLEGDLADARVLHVSLMDPQALADFYGVSLKEYQLGQTFWAECMPHFLSDRLAHIPAHMVLPIGYVYC